MANETCERTAQVTSTSGRVSYQSTCYGRKMDDGGLT
jgi:hypothetical protein